MKKNKAGCGGQRRGCYFRYRGQGGLTGKGTFLQRPEGMSLWVNVGRAFQAQGRASAKALM